MDPKHIMTQYLRGISVCLRRVWGPLALTCGPTGSLHPLPLVRGWRRTDQQDRSSPKLHSSISSAQEPRFYTPGCVGKSKDYVMHRSITVWSGEIDALPNCVYTHVAYSLNPEEFIFGHLFIVDQRSSHLHRMSWMRHLVSDLLHRKHVK